MKNLFLLILLFSASAFGQLEVKPVSPTPKISDDSVLKSFIQILDETHSFQYALGGTPGDRVLKLRAPGFCNGITYEFYLARENSSTFFISLPFLRISSFVLEAPIPAESEEALVLAKHNPTIASRLEVGKETYTNLKKLIATLREGGNPDDVIKGIAILPDQCDLTNI